MLGGAQRAARSAQRPAIHDQRCAAVAAGPQHQLIAPYQRREQEHRVLERDQRLGNQAAIRAVGLTQQFAAHPQGRLGTLYCQRWQVEGRILLLGDAAHAIVPFHGQGLNCGFEDCRLLDRLLSGPEAGSARERGAIFERFEHQRQPDTAAIAAMALENYQEMRDAVRSPQFVQRQGLAAKLERRFPGRFIPRYSMVMFHALIPYAEAQRRGAAQERVLQALMADAHVRELEDASAAWVEALLDQAGL